MTLATGPKTALVLGGASDIGLAIISRLVPTGLERVVLATRDPAALEDRLMREPLGTAVVTTVAWDALDSEAHAGLVSRAQAELGAVDLVVCAVGSLGHHSGLTFDERAADLLIRTNFAGPAAALLVVARALQAQGHGTIVVLSSVAGARARRSNFVYGSAKAGIDAFAQGLGDALAGTGVTVHVIRPGFVTTKMTEGLTPAPLATTPGAVADAVAGVLGSERNRIVWVPRVLGPAFVVFRNLPASWWRAVAGDR